MGDWEATGCGGCRELRADSQLAWLTEPSPPAATMTSTVPESSASRTKRSVSPSSYVTRTSTLCPSSLPGAAPSWRLRSSGCGSEVCRALERHSGHPEGYGVPQVADRLSKVHITALLACRHAGQFAERGHTGDKSAPSAHFSGITTNSSSKQRPERDTGGDRLGKLHARLFRRHEAHH